MFNFAGIESSIGLYTLQSRGSEVIWKNVEHDTLPTMVPRILEEEGRTCRNIGSVDHKEVGGRNGGQERTHSVEVLENGGIAGILRVEKLEESRRRHRWTNNFGEGSFERECGRE